MIVYTVITATKQTNQKGVISMTLMKKGYYTADSITGVSFYGDHFDEPETEVMPAQLFYESLPTVKIDETIVTFIEESDIQVLEAIDDEYGIN